MFIPSHLQDTQQPAVPVSPSHRQRMSSAPRSPQLSPLRRQPSPMSLSPGPRVQLTPDHYSTTPPIPFPEPHFYRPASNSHRENPSPPSNRSTHSLSNSIYNSNNMTIPYTSPSVSSFSSSYVEDDHYGEESFEVCSSIFISIIL